MILLKIFSGPFAVIFLYSSILTITSFGIFILFQTSWMFYVRSCLDLMFPLTNKSISSVPEMLFQLLYSVGEACACSSS